MVLRFDAADMMAGGGRQESEYVQETAPFRWTVYSLSAELWGTTKCNITRTHRHNRVAELPDVTMIDARAACDRLLPYANIIAFATV